jgi:hypothetical protein
MVGMVVVFSRGMSSGTALRPEGESPNKHKELVLTRRVDVTGADDDDS